MKRNYAGFWKRFIAFLLDNIMLQFLVVIVTMSFGYSFDLHPFRVRGEGGALAGGLSGLILPWLYYAGMESSALRATVGKRLLGLEVVDMQGRRINFLRATGRHFAKILSTVILFIGFIMAAFTPKKQGLHDILARCLVVERE